MAYTKSLVARSVFGNLRMVSYRLTADAATQAVATELNKIQTLSWAPQSCTTAAIKFAVNEDASGTANNGTVGVSGAASGDELFLTVYGN